LATGSAIAFTKLATVAWPRFLESLMTNMGRLPSAMAHGG